MSLTLTINQFINQCRYIGRAQDSALIAGELQQLASLLSAEISTQLAQQLNNQSGIYCIRQLNLSITLPRQQLSARRLGALLAKQLAAVLDTVLQQPQLPADCRFFASEADYIAAFMQSLLQHGHAELWLFAQYHSLRHLSSSDAIVQLLLPRLASLLQISRALAKLQACNPLNQQLNNAQAEYLLQHWLGDSQLAPFSTAGLPLATLARLQQQLPHPGNRSSQPLALSVVASVLSELNGIPAVADISPHSLLLLLLQRQLLLRCQQPLTAALSAKSSPVAAAAATAELQPLLADALYWMAQHSSHQRYIAWCLGLLNSNAGAPSNETAAAGTAELNRQPNNGQSEAVSNDSNDAIAANQPFYSSQAALVLLLPVLLGLRLQQYYSAAGLRLALLQALAPTLDTCAVPVWLLQLLPDHSCATQDSPQLPPLWRQGLTDTEQQQLCTLSGTAQLTALLLRHFAGRLSGLQRSSSGYLRQQFLQGGGVITLGTDTIYVRLNPIAMAIVLQMAGLAGWCDSLPWLKKNLTIEVTG